MKAVIQQIEKAAKSGSIAPRATEAEAHATRVVAITREMAGKYSAPMQGQGISSEKELRPKWSTLEAKKD
jgi:hypothetical protein